MAKPVGIRPFRARNECADVGRSATKSGLSALGTTVAQGRASVHRGKGERRFSMRALKSKLLLPTCVAFGLASGAWAQSAADPLAPQRCATRLSVAFLGVGASSSLFQSTNPQGQVDALLQDPAFQDRFARFVNSTFNDQPGDTAQEDASYYLS